MGVVQITGQKQPFCQDNSRKIKKSCFCVASQFSFGAKIHVNPMAVAGLDLERSTFCFAGLITQKE